ncbi:hypothetical protein MU448_00740 [Streptococcus sp. O1]|uniref:hypothetical protein n=1 Tax=Streptococcus sp. O1 TaxID=2928735 RepID=UPI00211B53B5|nr:hypothetical protein [Streptococcus sp. O1]MCQ9213007.1 hypothetical protein [Streptococcus sp. O1]
MATKGSTLTTYPRVQIAGRQRLAQWERWQALYRQKYGVKADNQVVTWIRKYREIQIYEVLSPLVVPKIRLKHRYSCLVYVLIAASQNPLTTFG